MLAVEDSDLAKDAMETPPRPRMFKKRKLKGKRKDAMNVDVGGKGGKDGKNNKDGAGRGGKNGKKRKEDKIDKDGAGGGGPNAMNVVVGVFGRKLKMDKKSAHSRAWHSTLAASLKQGMNTADAKAAASKAGKLATETLG